MLPRQFSSTIDYFEPFQFVRSSPKFDLWYKLLNSSSKNRVPLKLGDVGQKVGVDPVARETRIVRLVQKSGNRPSRFQLYGVFMLLKIYFECDARRVVLRSLFDRNSVWRRQ